MMYSSCSVLPCHKLVYKVDTKSSFVPFNQGNAARKAMTVLSFFALISSIPGKQEATKQFCSTFFAFLSLAQKGVLGLFRVGRACSSIVSNCECAKPSQRMLVTSIVLNVF